MHASSVTNKCSCSLVFFFLGGGPHILAVAAALSFLFLLVETATLPRARSTSRLCLLFSSLCLRRPFLTPPTGRSSSISFQPCSALLPLPAVCPLLFRDLLLLLPSLLGAASHAFLHLLTAGMRRLAHSRPVLGPEHHPLPQRRRRRPVVVRAVEIWQNFPAHAEDVGCCKLRAPEGRRLSPRR